MKKQMIWGLAILMLLIGIAGVFLLIPQDTDTEPEKVFNPPSEEMLQNIRDKLAAQKSTTSSQTISARCSTWWTLARRRVARCATPNTTRTNCRCCDA